MRSKNISINKHTIVIFGSKGMLGKNILFYFKKKNKILKFEKKFNASSFVAELKKLNSKKPHIIFILKNLIYLLIFYFSEFGVFYILYDWHQ